MMLNHEVSGEVAWGRLLLIAVPSFVILCDVETWNEALVHCCGFVRLLRYMECRVKLWEGRARCNCCSF